MQIVKLANCTLYIYMYSLSALYMLQSVPIVKVTLVILFKKKKKKKRKTTHTSVWVKIPKLCHKIPTIYLAIWHSIFSPQPRQESSPTEQNSSTQEGTNFGHAMFLCNLEPEKCQNLPRNSTNFRHTMFLRNLEPEKCQNLPRNSTNFGHAMFLRNLEPEKRQNLPRNSMNFSNAISLHYL